MPCGYRSRSEETDFNAFIPSGFIPSGFIPSGPPAGRDNQAINDVGRCSILVRKRCILVLKMKCQILYFFVPYVSVTLKHPALDGYDIV